MPATVGRRHLKTRGAYYDDWAARRRCAPPDELGCGGWNRRRGAACPGCPVGALPGRSADAQPAHPVPVGRADRVRGDGRDVLRARCTRHPLARSISRPRLLKAMARVFAREAAYKVAARACAGRCGAGQTDPDLAAKLGTDVALGAQAGLLGDLDRIARDLNRAFPAD